MKWLAIVVLLALSPASSAQSAEWRNAYAHAEELRARYDEFLSRRTDGKLTLKRIEEGIAPQTGIPFTKYEMWVSGLKDDGLYDVMTWPVESEKPTTVLIGVSVRPDGRVLCLGEKREECKIAGADSGVNLTLSNADPGQPFRYGVFSVSFHRMALAQEIPNPIEVRDGRCRIEAIRLMRHFEVALLKIDGFFPGATVTMDGVSYGERHTGTFHANDDGTGELVLLPFVKGHSSGISEITVSDGKCSPKIRFEWGKSLSDKPVKD